MYSDASKSESKGFGAYCRSSWTFHQWEPGFIVQKNPSVEFLELYGLAVGVLLWIRRFRNRNMNLFCDNTTVRDQVNKQSARDKNAMYLLRRIVLECMVYNVNLKVKYVESAKNGKADALSRLQL